MTALVVLLLLLFRSLLAVQAVDSDINPPLGPATLAPDTNAIRELSSSDLQSLAMLEFESGMGFRHDATRARPRFREAFRLYDELWRRGFRDPDLALNRAHSRRLSGDLPGAIVALNEGLAQARWHRPLQIALEDARTAVAYPRHSDLAALCRPATHSTIGTRMRPREAVWIAGILWFLASGSVARFAMTRSGWWLGFAGVCLVVLAVFGALWLQDYRMQRRGGAQVLVVLAQDVDLRKGNGDAYPLRLDGPSRMPRGVEASELTRRGGWVQIRLASGIIGWVPETAVLSVGG